MLDGFLSAFLLLIVLMPVVLFFLMLALAHLLPPPPMVARTSFECPYSKRRVDVAFLTSPTVDHATDVLSCSLFADAGRIRCKKECLSLADTYWQPSPMLPRYSLIADDVAYRGEPAEASTKDGSPPAR